MHSVPLCLPISAWLAVVPLLGDAWDFQAAQARQSSASDQHMNTDCYGDPLPLFARARLGTLRLRQGRRVAQVRFSADGRTLLSIDNQDLGRVWDTATGKELYHFPMTISPNQSLLTADLRTLVTWKGDSAIQFWDTATNKLLRELTSVNDRLGPACLTPDGKGLLAVATDEDTDQAVIRQWELASGKRVREMVPSPCKNGRRFRPLSVYFVGDGKVLVSDGLNEDDGGHRFWDFATGKELSYLMHYPNLPPPCLLSPDGKIGVVLLLKGQRQAHIWLVDLPNGKKIHELDAPFLKYQRGVTNAFVRGLRLSFSPDSQTFAAKDEDYALHLWNITTGKALPEAIPGLEKDVQCFAFSPNSRMLARGHINGNLDLLDLFTGRRRFELQGYAPALSADSSFIHRPNIAFSPDGKLLAAKGGENLVRLWNTADGKEIVPVSAGHQGRITCLALSAEGTMLASAADDGTVRLWDPATNRQLKVFGVEIKKENPEWTGPIAIAFSPDGKLIAAGTGSGLIYLWQVDTGELQHRFQDHVEGVFSLVFTPDGRRLIIGVKGRVHGRDVASGQEASDYVSPQRNADQVEFNETRQIVAISPDGRLLAASSQEHKRVVVLELVSGKIRKQLPAPVRSQFGKAENSSAMRFHDYPQPLSYVTFSPNSKLLAWSQGIEGIQLWDVVQGKELRQFGGQAADVTAIAFSPRDGFLAAASDDGTVRFWNPATGKILGELLTPRGGFTCLAFSPDGKTLYTAGTDTTILVWDIDRLTKHWQLAQPETSIRELEKMWGQLASPKAAEAAAAMARLETMPEKAVLLLRDHLRPVPKLSPRHVERLLADLESNQFKIRKQATLELERLEERAEPYLRRRLAAKPALEVRRRIEQILERLADLPTRPEQLRARRAIEILEHLGTAEAQAVLGELANGAPESRQTEDAKGSLGRLARRALALP